MTLKYTPHVHKPTVYTGLQFIEQGIGSHSHVAAYNEIQRAIILQNTIEQDPIYCALSLVMAGYAREDTVRLQDCPSVFAMPRNKGGILVGYVDPKDGKTKTGLCADRVMAVTALRMLRELVKAAKRG